MASQSSLFWAPGTPKTHRVPSTHSAATAALAPGIRPRTPPWGRGVDGSGNGGGSWARAGLAARAVAPSVPSAPKADRRLISTAQPLLGRAQRSLLPPGEGRGEGRQ